jgi:hypothetical protein
VTNLLKMVFVNALSLTGNPGKGQQFSSAPHHAPLKIKSALFGFPQVQLLSLQGSPWKGSKEMGFLTGITLQMAIKGLGIEASRQSGQRH